MPLLHDWLLETAKERGSGSGTALVYRDTYLSWRGLVHRVDRRAQELSGLGVGPGTWVGMMLGNVPELVILTLALSKLRAIVVPLDPTTSTRELDMILDAAPLRALVTRPHGGDAPTPPPPARTDGKRHTARHVPEGRRRLQGTLLNVHLYKRTPKEQVAGVTPEVVLFTADAGGDPKGVARTARELEAIAATVVDGLDYTAEERVLCATPLHHAFGFDLGLLAPLRRGTGMFLEDEVSSKRLSKLLRDEPLELVLGGPALFGALAREVTVKPLEPRIAKIARFVSSGSALPAGVADAFLERYGVRLLSCYHATETGPLAIDRAGKDPTTVGKPFAGVELRLGTGNETGATAGGPLPVWVRTAGTSTAFVPELPVPSKSGGVAVGRAGDDGWFRTGDLGTLDKTGRLTLTGREDDVVKVDGKRVALGEVAGCLEAFAKVREAEALVVPDDFGGPMVVARVVPAGACKAEELIDHCARNLAPYKVPRHIEFCEHLG